MRAKINNILWLSAAFLLLASHVYAEPSAGPLHIVSDTLDVEHEQNLAEFAGQVHLTQDDFELFCDRLVAHYKDKLGGEIEKAHAYGNVKIRQGERHGHSDNATYDYNTGLLVLLEHAEMEDDSGMVRGEKIEHNLNTKQTRVLDQQAGGRVRMTIKQSEASKP